MEYTGAQVLVQELTEENPRGLQPALRLTRHVRDPSLPSDRRLRGLPPCGWHCLARQGKKQLVQPGSLNQVQRQAPSSFCSSFSSLGPKRHASGAEKPAGWERPPLAQVLYPPGGSAAAQTAATQRHEVSARRPESPPTPAPSLAAPQPPPPGDYTSHRALRPVAPASGGAWFPERIGTRSPDPIRVWPFPRQVTPVPRAPTRRAPLSPVSRPTRGTLHAGSPPRARPGPPRLRWPPRRSPGRTGPRRGRR